jgi:hypothetical protein
MPMYNSSLVCNTLKGYVLTTLCPTNRRFLLHCTLLILGCMEKSTIDLFSNNWILVWEMKKFSVITKLLNHSQRRKSIPVRALCKMSVGFINAKDQNFQNHIIVLKWRNK